MSAIDEEGDIFGPLTGLINAVMAKIDEVMTEVRRTPTRTQLQQDIRQVVREELERLMTDAIPAPVVPAPPVSHVVVPSTPTHTVVAEAALAVEAKPSQSQKVWNWLKTH